MAKGMKTGGRVKGTPNKENPLKGYIRAHSMSYFEPKSQVNEDGSPRKITLRDRDNVVVGEITLADSDGKPLFISDFDADMLQLDPEGRVHAELRLLKFHMPEMKAIDMDMTVSESAKTIEERLAELSGEEDEE